MGVLRLHTSPRSVVITETKIQNTSRKICSNTLIMQRKRGASAECLIAFIFLLRAEFSRKKMAIQRLRLTAPGKGGKLDFWGERDRNYSAQMTMRT